MKGTRSPRYCVVCGQHALPKVAAQRWFCWNLDVEDAPCSVQPVTQKVDETITKVGHDQQMTSHDTIEELNIHHQTVLKKAEHQTFGRPARKTYSVLLQSVKIYEASHF